MVDCRPWGFEPRTCEVKRFNRQLLVRLLSNGSYQQVKTSCSPFPERAGLSTTSGDPSVSVSSATGTPVKSNSTGLVEFQMKQPFQYLVWYHAVGLIWISEFILAFQQMTIAGAVVTYYFTRYAHVHDHFKTLDGTAIHPFIHSWLIQTRDGENVKYS